MSADAAIVYRFHIESPYIGSDYTTEIDYDEEPTEQELLHDLETIYANHFPGSWERISGPDSDHQDPQP